MIGPGRRRRNRRILLTVTLVSTLGGGIYGVLVAETADGGLAAGILQGLVAGFLISLPCTLFEIATQSLSALRRLRSLPFLGFLALRTAVYVGAIMGGPALADRIATPSVHDAAEGGWIMRREFWLSLAAAFLASLLLEMARLLGPDVLASFVAGRYHRPREEERVFLFADVEGSTGLAERIGHVAFHRFLNALFIELDEPILAAGGEIYRYVGDGVIVTWPVARGLAGAACLEAALGIHERAAALGPAFAARFGAAPALRCAVHAGPVVAGEMGDVRKEVAFLGDTVNTASRLEKAARDLGVRVIVSASLAARLPDRPGIRLAPLPPVLLPGKATPVAVLAAERRGPARSDDRREARTEADGHPAAHAAKARAVLP